MDESERIERRLKLHDLRVLMAVVERGSMVKAAERLATSQPAVSRAIADLEYSLGVQLLDRGPRGIVPTPYGRALIKRGVAVFDELKQGVKDIEFLADPTTGEVRIAAPIAMAAGFLAAVIERLTLRHPRVTCHVMTGELAVISRALEERHVDAMIAVITEPIGENLQAEILFEGSRFVVAATANRWSRRRKVGLADLMNEPWTLPPPDSEPGLAAANDFRAAGLDVPRATVITYTDVARVALVAQGRFLTISTSRLATFAGGITTFKALPIELPTAGSVGILTLKNRTLTPVTQLFIDCARELAKPLVAGKSVSARRR